MGLNILIHYMSPELLISKPDKDIQEKKPAN